MISSADVNSPTALFGCSGVCLSLGGRQILNDVSLAVEPSRILGLIGPNGAGKTSLFEVLCGRYQASHGRVFFAERDITDMPFHQRSRIGIARTFQSPVVPMALTVAETLRAARKACRPHLSRHDAERGLRLAQLRVPLDTPASVLDTFDRRKLLLACLLMRDPSVLLMDEPASGLINTEIDELDMIVRRLVDEYRMAVILIEHRLELLSAIADSVVVLDLGEVIARGDPQQVFNDPRVHQAYFDSEAVA